MSDSNNKIKPIFRSTFDPLTDGDGFLINQKDLISQEVSGNSLLVLRTSSSSKNNTKVAKDLFNLTIRLKLKESYHHYQRVFQLVIILELMEFLSSLEVKLIIYWQDG